MNPKLASEIHEFCTLLALGVYEGNPARFASRLLALRRSLHSAMREGGADQDVIAGVDALYRVLRRNDLPVAFMTNGCEGESVRSFQVAIAEQGEIRSMKSFTAAVDAQNAAEKEFYTRAWPGSVVLLLAKLSDGKLIACDSARVEIRKNGRT